MDSPNISAPAAGHQHRSSYELSLIPDTARVFRGTEGRDESQISITDKGENDSSTALPMAAESSAHGDSKLQHQLSGGLSNDMRGKGKEGERSPEEGSPATTSEPEHHYMTGLKLWVTFSAMLLTMFLVTLDQTITSTAIPRIASDFNALDDVAWIASAYFLTEAGLLPLYGQIIVITTTKWIYVTAVALFELGSLICGVAPNVNVLIFGRAFAGLGAAGIFICVLSLIAQIARLEDRPLLFGSFGVVFMASAVAGPLLGGVFSDYVTWRWCFFINLPIGAVSILVILWLLEAIPPIGLPNGENRTELQKWLRLDWLGAALVIGIVTTILLPLQWGGSTKPWSDPAVIACFVVCGFLLLVFIAWEHYQGTDALVPLPLFRRRTQIGTCIEAFLLMFAVLLATYYLPLQYQAKGHSATQSGVDLLPYMLSNVLASFTVGAIINFTGHYWGWMFGGPLVTSVGAGLLFTLSADASNGQMIGYQILFGAGLGASVQQTFIAIQAEYHDDEKMVPQASSLVLFAQLVGGTIGIAICGTIFDNQLTTELIQYASFLPANVTAEIRQSVTVIPLLPAEYQQPVIEAYVRALDYVYIIGVPVGALAAIAALLSKNRNIKALGIKMGGGAA